ncbi:MAG: hypothetical protein HOC24_13525 [Deltaproteobacteria bacterium]|jgi:hypothetical protein|nr:hypothetical protein [Deltaproteobacteria bacterium]
MSFFNPLYDRIQQLIGVKQNFEEDFSFLRPSGNDHLVQFCFRMISSEYLELSQYDQQHFFLLDLLEETGIEYQLDVNGEFAIFTEKNKKGVKTIQSVMDLRNESIAVIYYFGVAKPCLQLNSQLMQSLRLTACYLNPSTLKTVSQSLSGIRSFQYYFEQSSLIFKEPVVMKGSLKGDIVPDAYQIYCQQFSNWFNIIQLSGHTTDGSQGVMTIDANGKLQIDICRLSSFLKIIEKVFSLLNDKYHFILDKYVNSWQGDPHKNSIMVCSCPIQVELPYAIEFLENLSKTLTVGKKPLNLMGLYERISPKLWKIFITELNTANQIDLEISTQQILIFIHCKWSLPMLDKIESFLRNNIAANFESLALN